MAELSRYFPSGSAVADAARATFSTVATGMEPSRILAIAYSVREAIARGAQVTQFTVGDFAPDQFPIPRELEQGITDALRAGQTNYPPADGVPELRKAIAQDYRDTLGLDYPLDSVVVASGARPGLYAIYRCLVEPGETVVAPVPSWNNDSYAQLVGAEFVPVPSKAEDGFMPTAEGLAPHLRTARLLVICSPLNPCGTMIKRDQLAAICTLVLDENTRREAAGERSLYLVYDQVYRLLTFGPEHITPVQVAPEMARYTIFCDAISKSFAATGLRVGWVVAPPFIAERLRALLTHMGAWAPRPEQRAVARLLENPEAVARFLAHLKAGIQQRLEVIHQAFKGFAAEGLPVAAVAPEGAIYLSAYFGLEGRPGLPDEDAVRLYLLEAAGCAVVPFSAFGDETNRGWWRFSVGAVSVEDTERCMQRLGVALRKAVGQAE